MSVKVDWTVITKRFPGQSITEKLTWLYQRRTINEMAKILAVGRTTVVQKLQKLDIRKKKPQPYGVKKTTGRQPMDAIDRSTKETMRMYLRRNPVYATHLAQSVGAANCMDDEPLIMGCLSLWVQVVREALKDKHNESSQEFLKSEIATFILSNTSEKEILESGREYSKRNYFIKKANQDAQYEGDIAGTEGCVKECATGSFH